jgi:alpha-tubulin suppressor-like RCC1 family protein
VLSGVLVACGSAPAPSASAPAAAAHEPSAPASSPKDGAPAAASSASAPAASASPAAKGGATLAQLSSADPDCALDAEGRPWRWPNGKLERGPADVKGAKAISCSSSHTCVVTAEATVACWGDNALGALGDGTEKSSPDAPVAVKGVTGAAEIVVDVSRSCARTTGGEVYCWGDREFAKAGDGTLIDGHKGREKPLAGKPVLGLSGAASLGISLVHACAATNDGNVMCWGQCRSGACGLPPRPPWIARATKAPKVSGIATLSAGDAATCGIDKAGAVSCWGTSQFGVLGDAVSDTKPHDAPAKIALPAPAAEVAVGIGGHACARLATGAVHCWGHNDKGQLGDGTTTDRKTAVKVSGVEKATRIAAGLDGACAIADGRLFCWGQKHGGKPVEIK